jgi:hypothetical protein
VSSRLGHFPGLVAQPVERRLAARSELRLKPLLERLDSKALFNAALSLVGFKILKQRPGMG